MRFYLHEFNAPEKYSSLCYMLSRLYAIRPGKMETANWSNPSASIILPYCQFQKTETTINPNKNNALPVCLAFLAMGFGDAAWQTVAPAV
jgi:hypothetical protein